MVEQDESGTETVSRGNILLHYHLQFGVLNVLFEQEAIAIDGKVNTMSAQIEQTPSHLSSATGTAQTIQTGASHRQHILYIDNLRILLISMVIVVYLGVTYGAAGSWYYHDPAINLPTAVILTFISGPGIATGVGIFFLIAGYFTPGSYDRKGFNQIVSTRSARPIRNSIADLRSVA